MPRHWRHIPAKLPHLVLLWIQQLVNYLADTFTLQQLGGFWLTLLAIIYFLPSATRPDREERRLAQELIELEKEVRVLAVAQDRVTSPESQLILLLDGECSPAPLLAFRSRS